MAAKGRHLLFDAEGVLAEKKYLINEGVLVGVLCDIATQSELGVGRPGNAYRVPPDHEIRISPSNTVMKIRGHHGDRYSACVEDLGTQSGLNPTTGILSGIAIGYKVTTSGKTPAMFQLKIDVNKLLADVLPASDPVWIGSTFVPSFIAVV